MTVRPLVAIAVLAVAAPQAAVSIAQPRTASAGTPARNWLGPTLCAPTENVVFSCQARNGKIASVCASKAMGPQSGYLQYRFGRPGKIELLYPKSRVHPRNLFEYSLYAQGNTSLSFTNGGVTYTMVDQLRSEEDEVLVERGGRLLSRIVCNNADGQGMKISRPDILGIASTPYGN